VPTSKQELNSGIPVPGKCPGLGEQPISIFLVRAAAAVHKTFEYGYRKGQSW